ncbi:hypothetical protein DFJ58DRAFT_848016 [Suillus subalutaceus]|uniref:uncharacterized protein n=1 Tax=Suillus subalutaceus TaxID=48586 RepID=UPI001B876131|nr:uncharacterized protein DFJ58DRAFT_848016 [Suillus subalutaceus]KAG1832351.1 hypothetical protein DFJ58DRAFT_848016 [Suillus subalutaceus]
MSVQKFQRPPIINPILHFVEASTLKSKSCVAPRGMKFRAGEACERWVPGGEVELNWEMNADKLDKYARPRGMTRTKDTCDNVPLMLIASLHVWRPDIRLWRFPMGTELARLKHSDPVFHLAFSVDGRSIFSGGWDEKISQWEIPEDILIAAENDLLVNAKNEVTTPNCDFIPFHVQVY